MKKICSKCKEEKSLELFHLGGHKKGSRRADCKACVKKRMKIAYATWSEARKRGDNRKILCSCGGKKTKFSLLCIKCAQPRADYSIYKWRVDKYGYVVSRTLKDGKKTFVFQHRVVMEAYLGRKLERHENVHHKNGVKHDNRIDNLELWTTSQPSGQRIQDKIKWCKEFLEKYGSVAER